TLVGNIQSLGFRAEDIAAVIATHAHIDHIGSLGRFQSRFGAKVIAHELEIDAIETGVGTGAEFYGVAYEPCDVDVKLSQPEETLNYCGYALKTIHIPGHTRGGIAVYMDAGKRVLFGQDIHGPYFLPGADTAAAKVSLQRLIDLKADILCEGHFGVYQPAREVRSYIEQYLHALQRQAEQ
ncbi:MAG: MBL fold metallo-hydrolase, partial [Chloroflexi bacterium]|nr:MBL fold metallo-hydrolase [Chloroflexota bacterium]